MTDASVDSVRGLVYASSMSKNRRTIPQEQRTRSAVAVSAKLRSGAGVHADQHRKSDARQLRRDKAYRDER